MIFQKQCNYKKISLKHFRCMYLEVSNVIGDSKFAGGGFATVHVSKAWVTATTFKIVAIKKVKNLDKLAIKDFKNLEKEVKYSALANHENCVTLYRTLIQNNSIYFIQDYCAFGSVHDIICAIDKFSYGLPTSVVLHVLYGVASGLNYLHNSGFIHRSLEGQHVLISYDGSVKLSGFRYITEVECGKNFNFPKTNDSTRLNFLAPEILSQNSSGYDQKSDVYSLGILVCYLCNGIIPFSEFISPARMFLEKITGARPYRLKILKFVKKFSNLEKKILKKFCTYLIRQLLCTCQNKSLKKYPTLTFRKRFLHSSIYWPEIC